jgi:hypothetical protein
MEIERAKQAAYRMACADAGRKGGGNPNFQKGKPNPYKRPLSTGDKGSHKGRINSPSPSPSPSPVSDLQFPIPPSGGTGNGAIAHRSRFEKPSLEAMKMQGAKIGLPESEAEACFNHYESNGWLVGRNPMRSWPAAMQNWKKTFEEKRYGNNRQDSGKRDQSNVQAVKGSTPNNGF